MSYMTGEMAMNTEKIWCGGVLKFGEKTQLKQMVKNIESSSKSSAPDEPTKESFFQRLDISYSISESSNTSNPVSISTSMRKRYSFLEDHAKTLKFK